MKKQLLYLAITFLSVMESQAVTSADTIRNGLINDGPYIFYINNKITARWIRNSVLRTDHIERENFIDLKERFGLLFDYSDIRKSFFSTPDYNQCFAGIDSIAAITDIHGNYESYIKLLKSSGIIDKNLNWKFGSGHVVILGDSFDRGDMVTELLWHIYGMQKQALKTGGMVHVLLGNHETLMLSHDLRYMHEKYAVVEKITETGYFDLYSDNSVLGRWLRRQPVIITINNIIFVHAGVSIEMVRRNLSVAQINRMFSAMMLQEQVLAENELDDLVFLTEEDGPIWYRGFFTDSGFCENKLDSILNFYGKEHIVVGHTASNGIKQLLQNKILGIDTGLGMNQSGEILLYKNGEFFKSSITGKRIRL